MNATVKIDTDFSYDTNLQKYIVNTAIKKALADIYGLLADTEVTVQKYQNIAIEMFDLLDDFQKNYPDEFKFCYPDAKIDTPQPQYHQNTFPIRKRKKLYRRLQHQKYKKRLKFLTSISGWVSGAYYSEHKQRYVRFYRGSRSKYLKKLGNRIVRQYKDNITYGGNYKKIYDFWWNYS